MQKTFFVLILFVVTAVCALEPIEPLPTTLDGINLEKAKLGRTLFLDPILSSDGTISCASCHSFEHGGADKRDVSLGVQGRKGDIQSPTVYNSRYNFKQFWNGRVDSLQDQATGPLTAHSEMDMSPEKIEKVLNKNLYYLKQFKKIYHKSHITIDDVVDALVTFEMTLVTPNSRFDRYLRGELELSEDEKRGYSTFKALGCITCHNGINVGANSFQKMGLFKPYKYNTKFPDRYAHTNKEYHKNVYKVPTLRNITLTAPYFHDAQAKTLEEAVKMMATHNLGISITQQEVDDIISFLKTLEGERPMILDLP